jgi:kumamolisin
VNAKTELDNTGEVMMDVQIVAGLCPAAKLSVYFAKDSQKGWVDLLDQVIKEGPAVLSISWGAAEDSDGWSKAARNALNDRLNLAAALGITVVCAAGDDGSGDMQNNRRAHVDFPSSSPFVLAVGGTMITHHQKKFVEEAWRVGKGRRVGGRGGATGGGVSIFYDRPKWQDVSIKSVNKHSRDGRVVPDITALAGPPMYDLVFQDEKDSVGGGTSASAPVLAALIARINALLHKSKRRRFLTPLLYRKAPQGDPMGRLVCRDVTMGYNTSIPFPGRGYKATKGFDAVSGWGTPIGTALLLALT